MITAQCVMRGDTRFSLQLGVEGLQIVFTLDRNDQFTWFPRTFPRDFVEAAEYVLGEGVNTPYFGPDNEVVGIFNRSSDEWVDWVIETTGETQFEWKMKLRVTELRHLVSNIKDFWDIPRPEEPEALRRTKAEEAIARAKEVWSEAASELNGFAIYDDTNPVFVAERLLAEGRFWHAQNLAIYVKRTIELARLASRY